MHRVELQSCRPVIDLACPAAAQLSAVLARYRPTVIDVCRALRTGELAECAQASFLAVGARTSDLVPVERLASQLRATLPHLPIVLVGELSKPLAASVPSYVRAGIDDVVLLHHGRVDEITLQMCSVRACAPPPELEIRALSDAWRDKSMGLTALNYVRNSVAFGRHQHEVRRFGRTRRRISSLLRDANLPSPGMLVRAGRMFHVQHLIREGSLSRSEIARRVGYETAEAVRIARWRLLQSVDDDRLTILRTLLEP